MTGDVGRRVGAELGAETVAVDPLSGGEVGSVYRVDLADGRTVAAKVGPTPLDREGWMLRYLGERGLPVPAVRHADSDLLVLDYVAGDGDVAAAERDVGRHLARLHGETAEAFGFPRDTLSGRLDLPNPWTDSWVAFFRDQRLRWALEVATERDPPVEGVEAGVVPESLAARVRAFADSLDDVLPSSPTPALLHGDVWENNVVVGDGEVRAFLDPACYYGHAEVEVAYATWAGFGDEFLDAYRDARGLDLGFEGRRDAYLLVPRLLHAWYFPDDRERYLDAVAATLAAFGY